MKFGTYLKTMWKYIKGQNFMIILATIIVVLMILAVIDIFTTNILNTAILMN